ncbi:helix-turn-helix transcriptional regulator [Tenacibaculum sp. nBUS_03]|uniref:helix-turn-helix transcriptional regulator n=1 Tax=Tenacibaculum sp. nBUS_03 TaxID=3395320 RepID=UPI003EB7C758
MLDIKKEREKLGLTQQELADHLGITRKTIITYENKGNIPESKTKLISYFFSQYSKSKNEEYSEEIKNFSESNVLFVPLVNHRNQEEFSQKYNNQNFINGLHKEPWIVDNPKDGNYVSFEIFGDSMLSDRAEESLLQNDILLCKEIEEKHWDRLPIKQYDFVLLHKTEGVLCRRIAETILDTQKLILEPLNPLYNETNVELNDVLAIYRIISVKRFRRRL